MGFCVVIQKSAIMPDVNYYTAVISACEKQQTAGLPNVISYRLPSVHVRKACSGSRLWDFSVMT